MAQNCYHAFFSIIRLHVKKANGSIRWKVKVDRIYNANTCIKRKTKKIRIENPRKERENHVCPADLYLIQTCMTRFNLKKTPSNNSIYKMLNLSKVKYGLTLNLSALLPEKSLMYTGNKNN